MHDRNSVDDSQYWAIEGVAAVDWTGAYRSSSARYLFYAVDEAGTIPRETWEKDMVRAQDRWKRYFAERYPSWVKGFRWRDTGGESSVAGPTWSWDWLWEGQPIADSIPADAFKPKPDPGTKKDVVKDDKSTHPDTSEKQYGFPTK